jgi:hypothetical protein
VWQVPAPSFWIGRVGAHCCHSEIAILRGERLRYFQRSRDPLRPTSKPRQARGFFYHGGILLPSRRAAQVREDCPSTEAAPFQEAGGSNSFLTGDASVWRRHSTNSSARATLESTDAKHAPAISTNPRPPKFRTQITLAVALPWSSQSAALHVPHLSQALMSCIQKPTTAFNAKGLDSQAAEPPIPRPDLWQRHQDRGESWPS